MVNVSEHIISAVGVDREDRKHILGLEAGATENAAAGSHRDLWALATILGRKTETEISQEQVT